MKKTLWLTAVLATALLSACSIKQPATQALAAAESSLATIRDAAKQYAPDELQTVETKLAGLKEELAAGKYKDVLAEAPALTDTINKLTETVNAKKTEALAAIEKAKDQWKSFSADIPQMVTAIQVRVETLTKTHKLPANLSQADFTSAKSGLDALKAGWTEASTAFTSGDVTAAVAKAQAMKDQGAELLKKLGVTAG